MDHTLVGNYNILLVLLSFVVIFLTSFSVFDVCSRMFGSRIRKRVLWAIVGSLTMGGGIWTMHFIGMLAYMLPTATNYNLFTLALSLAIVIIPLFAVLITISRNSVNKFYFILGSIVLATSIYGMHTLGVKALNHSSYLINNPLIFLFSLLFAFIPAFIFAKVTYSHRKNESEISLSTKLISGFFMGLSIFAMHYTAMLGTKITHNLPTEDTASHTVDPIQLATIIGIITILILGIVLISSYLDRKISIQSTQLKVNEQYYKSLFEDNSEAVVLFDSEGRFVHFNQTVHEFYGYSSEELLHQNFTSLILPDYLEHTLSHFKLAVAGSTTTYETFIAHKDGHLMDLHVKNIPVIVDDKIVGVFGIIKDITDAKRVQEELMEVESKYRSLVEQALVGVYILQGTKIAYLNPRLAEIIGYSQEEMYDMHLSDYVYEEDLSLVIKNINKRLEEGVTSLRYEFRAVRKDRKLVYLEVHGAVARYRGQDAVIGTIIDITARKKSEETIQHMAYTDYLTGLPNSNSLNKQLQELVDAKNETAVLLLELERLNTIRDTVGQQLGDDLILLICERIKLALSKEDVLTRWKEDKFVILLTTANQEKITQTAIAILDVISQPLKTGNYDVYVNPSIGISMYAKNSDNVETLLDMANSALQYAKQYGNNSYHYYTEDLNAKSRENLELEMDLYKAIEHGELSIHYQPQFNLSTGDLIGNEALIRWQHPKLGMVSPSTFIPIAEETGLIIPIGEWVLRTACLQNKNWQLAGCSPMIISVNLSSRQFSQNNLVEVVERILTETELDAKYLDLEITESMTMDVGRAIKTLHGLKKLGINISIDDFGKGYSSLSYLKEFPIDRLKIDQSFIKDCHHDPSNATIVKTIISMAHHLNIHVIAEGVETKEHLEFLQQNLCDEVQGYLLSKPLPVKELEESFPDLQRMIRRYGLTSEISHRLWLERELDLTKHKLQEIIRQQEDMARERIVSFIKNHDQ